MQILKGRRNLSQQELLSGNVRYIAEGIVVIVIAAYIFYENILMALLLSPYIFIHLKESQRLQEAKRRNILIKQFKDGIMSVSFALNVGYSIENSFSQAIDELVLLYGENADIVSGFRNIVIRMRIWKIFLLILLMIARLRILCILRKCSGMQNAAAEI